MRGNELHISIMPILTPWQQEVLERIQAGGRPILWPRRAGRSTIMRYLSPNLRRNGKPLIHKGGKP